MTGLYKGDQLDIRKVTIPKDSYSDIPKGLIPTGYYPDVYYFESHNSKISFSPKGYPSNGWFTWQQALRVLLMTETCMNFENNTLLTMTIQE